MQPTPKDNAFLIPPECNPKGQRNCEHDLNHVLETALLLTSRKAPAGKEAIHYSMCQDALQLATQAFSNLCDAKNQYADGSKRSYESCVEQSWKYMQVLENVCNHLPDGLDQKQKASMRFVANVIHNPDLLASVMKKQALDEDYLRKIGGEPELRTEDAYIRVRIFEKLTQIVSAPVMSHVYVQMDESVREAMKMATDVVKDGYGFSGPLRAPDREERQSPGVMEAFFELKEQRRRVMEESEINSTRMTHAIQLGKNQIENTVSNDVFEKLLNKYKAIRTAQDKIMEAIPAMNVLAAAEDERKLRELREQERVLQKEMENVQKAKETSILNKEREIGNWSDNPPEKSSAQGVGNLPDVSRFSRFKPR